MTPFSSFVFVLLGSWITENCVSAGTASSLRKTKCFFSPVAFFSEQLLYWLDLAILVLFMNPEDFEFCGEFPPYREPPPPLKMESVQLTLFFMQHRCGWLVEAAIPAHVLHSFISIIFSLFFGFYVTSQTSNTKIQPHFINKMKAFQIYEKRPFLDNKVKDHMVSVEIELAKDISETTSSAGIFKRKQTRTNSSIYSWTQLAWISLLYYQIRLRLLSSIWKHGMNNLFTGCFSD